MKGWNAFERFVEQESGESLLNVKVYWQGPIIGWLRWLPQVSLTCAKPTGQMKLPVSPRPTDFFTIHSHCSRMFSHFIVIFLFFSKSSVADLVQATACLGNPTLPFSGGCSSGLDYCSTLLADTARPNVCQMFVSGTNNGDVRAGNALALFLIFISFLF